MEYRTLGRTGWQVSPLMLGTMQFGGEWGSQQDTDSVATINTALDAGINILDTADFYGLGRVEEIVGRAIASRRESVYVATKYGYDFYTHGQAAGGQPRVYDVDYARKAIEGSLRRLGTDYIDILQAHNVPPELAASPEYFEQMNIFVEEGKIRAFGVTVGPGDFGSHEAIATAKHPSAATVMAAYHLLSQNPARVAFPFCRAQGVGVIARGPLAMGLLAGVFDEDTTFGDDDFRRFWDREDYLRRLEQSRSFGFLIEDPVTTPAEAALRFALSNEDISTVLVGMQTAEQVRDNVKVADWGPYEVEQLQRVADTYDGFDVHESPLPGAVKR